MFDGSLPEIGELAGVADAALVDAARGWAQAENAACARKQAVMAELFVRRTALPADERELWWIDPEAAVVAELAAAQHIGRGLAVHQTHRGVALRDRLPRVAELFAAGLISDLLVRAIVWRTYLITDPDAMAAVDAELAEQVTAWGPLSAKKIEQAIDALVEAHDPGALRRARDSARTRDVQFGSPTDEAGYTSLWARLYAGDAAVLQDRVSEIAHSVCEADPRTTGERRADALNALSAGQQQLPCGCADPDCAAAQHDQKPPVSAVIHIVADAATVSRRHTRRPDPTPTTHRRTAPAAECTAPPAYVIGGGILPAPLLAAMLERASVREIRHPGDGPPEPRHRPSRQLAEFVRCRDLTCRWPGCDVPADHCDLDHTVPYPVGPTHPSNLKCYCRFHHLLKTFWCGQGGWQERQLPDGTLILTSPTGHTYTTHPGSIGLFPALCQPTGQLPPADSTPQTTGDRGAMMPKRRHTRNHNRQRNIQTERRLNDQHVAQRNKPPPF